MTRTWLMYIGCLVVLVTVVARGDNAQTGPTPYPDKSDTAAWPGVGPIRVFDWMAKNRQSFWEHRAADHGAIVLAGDSLTDGWRSAGKPYYRDNRHKLANRGIGGDTSRGLLFRFKEDVVDLDPAMLVLLIGGNDLSAHAKPEGIAANITDMVAMARGHNPDLPIIFCTLPPRDNPKAPTKPGALDDLNSRIRQIAADTPNAHLIDLFVALSTPDGKPVPENFGDDLLHLSAKGYERFGNMLFGKIADLRNADYLLQTDWIDPLTESLAKQPYSAEESPLQQPTAPRIPPRHELVFSDEFNGDAVNPDKWFFRYIYENATLGHLNDEISWRSDDALSIEDHALTITAAPRGDGKWSTGVARSKFTLKYGYIEAAVKFPANRGAWPSFWLNSGVQYPDGTFSRLTWPPEIDIFELVNNGREGPEGITSFAHGEKARGRDIVNLFDKDKNYRPGYSFADGRWHVIACYWTPTTSATFIDGVKIIEREYRWLHNDGTEAAPAHVLLDMAIGGKWPGPPANDDPIVLQFDYLRVYQLAAEDESALQE